MLALVHDFETTGLTLHPGAKLSMQPKAIEFGGLLIDQDGNEIAELSMLIDPQQTLDPKVIKVTGITDDMLEGCPLFPAVYPEIYDLYARADVLISHNLPFDKAIMEFELQRLGVEGFPWPRHELCTVQAFVEEWGRRPKLTELYEKSIGEKLAQTHRALDDVRALAKIVIKERLLDMFE